MSDANDIVEIDGHQFRIAMLDGEAGRRLALDAMRMLGPALVSAAAGDLGTMFIGLASSAKTDEVDRIVNVLGSVSRAQLEAGADKWGFLDANRRKTFFQGRQRLQFAWIGTALKVQLSDFFDEKKPE